MDNIKSIENANSKAISVKNIDFQEPIRNFFKAMGEDPERPGIKNTPARFDKTMKYLLNGYDRKFEDEVSVFENTVKYNDMILLKNIDFFSLCEHHLLPFFGFAHIGYIPSDEGYLGISKLARVVDIYARRLQEQERLSTEIAQSLMDHGKAKGVAVLLEGRHLCNAARGIEKTSTVMTTCSYFGTLKDNSQLQQNFMELIRERSKI